MLIYFICPKCQAKLEVEAEAAETQLPCPHCGEHIRVPKKLLGPGITIGGFRIIRQIGCGAMGEVYLARQLSMGRDVALKILPARVTLRQHLVDRFLQEVRMQARLEHPHIVTAHEAGEDDGVYYMAMAYVKGEALDRIINREGAMNERKALDIVRKIAGALAYAWEEHRILHRDIKPSNIIIDHHGQPKLTDLGLSKSLDDGEGLTVTEMVMGTPNYMSPEQAAGSRTVDFRSDMYSLGMTMYHMLTGKLPYAGASAMDTLRKQAMESLPDPRDINKEVSSACVSLMQIMLSKDPAGRHTSWEALIGDVERVIHGQPPTRKPLAEGESAILRIRDAKRTTSRRAWPRKIAYLLLGVFALLILLTLVQRSRSPKAAPEPSETLPSLSADPIPVRSLDRPRRAKPDFPKPPRHRPPSKSLDSNISGPGPEGPGTKGKPEMDKSTVLEVMADLETRAREMVAEDRTEDAVRFLRGYDGYMAVETAELRLNLAAHIERETESQDKALIREREHAQQLKSALLDEAAGQLLSADYEGAAERFKNPPTELSSVMDDPEIEVTGHIVRTIPGMDQLILNSFMQDLGQMVRIAFKDGVQILRIDNVGSRSVEGRIQLPGAGFAGRRFAVEDLSLKERVRRIKLIAQPPQADIMCGLLLYQEGHYAAAMNAFQRSGTLIGDRLSRQMEDRFEGARNMEARRAYSGLLRAVGLPPDAELDPSTLRSVQDLQLPPHRIDRLKRGAERFRATFGDTEAGREAQPLIDIILAIGEERPSTRASGEFEDLSRALRAANPNAVGLLPVVQQTNEGLEVDLSDNPELTDLSPLRNLPIRKLVLNSTGVSDLMPLVGMPLRELELWNTRVTNVTPLRAMFELEHLILATEDDEERVTDISPLRQLRLRRLDLFGAGISDIRDLAQMKLEWLKIEKTSVSDIGPLKGMPLVSLYAGRTQVSDLSPLKGMQLETLNLLGAPVSNISALRTMPSLRDLDLSWTRVSDLEPLRNLSLRKLRLVVTPVTDLGPLAGTPIEELDIRHCWALQEFAALRRMPDLKTLHWNDAVQANFLAPVMESVQKQDFGEARLSCENIIQDYSANTAMREFLKTLQRFVDETLPLWQETMKTLRIDPRTLSAQALEFDGHAYLCIPSFLPHERAQQIAERVGGHLATITSQREQNWVTEHFTVPGTALWLGGTDHSHEGQWKWITGEPAHFAFWMPGQPDNQQGKEHHISMSSNGRWNDLDGQTPLPFVVEWDQLPD